MTAAYLASIAARAWGSSGQGAGQIGVGQMAKHGNTDVFWVCCKRCTLQQTSRQTLNPGSDWCVCVKGGCGVGRVATTQTTPEFWYMKNAGNFEGGTYERKRFYT